MIATPVATSAGVVSAVNKRPAATKAVLNGLLLGGRMSTIVLLSRSKTIKPTLGCNVCKPRSIIDASALRFITSSPQPRQRDHDAAKKPARKLLTIASSLQPPRKPPSLVQEIGGASATP